ncbi:unnamed protein product [Parascedosporium putredinis]|uniref:Uncharacterized protein n=1 Tax=Parascedosporium putredinis TaxID=1442378 RepID=A0A9P1H9D8_9PEZI|nr:unnamed protein product [Parascedosporium putredinis]CAI8001554.1 unnamed protein product [Parascedosporium putredinis]
MVPGRPGGFVPSYVHQNVANNKSCTADAQRAAAETLKFDQARAATAERQDRQRSSQDPGDAEAAEKDKGPNGDEQKPRQLQ